MYIKPLPSRSGCRPFSFLLSSFYVCSSVTPFYTQRIMSSPSVASAEDSHVPLAGEATSNALPLLESPSEEGNTSTSPAPSGSEYSPSPGGSESSNLVPPRKASRKSGSGGQSSNRRLRPRPHQPQHQERQHERRPNLPTDYELRIPHGTHSRPERVSCGRYEERLREEFANRAHACFPGPFCSFFVLRGTVDVYKISLPSTVNAADSFANIRYKKDIVYRYECPSE